MIGTPEPHYSLRRDEALALLKNDAQELINLQALATPDAQMELFSSQTPLEGAPPIVEPKTKS